MRTFPARYAGRCAICKERFLPGALITRRGKLTICASCAGQTRDDDVQVHAESTNNPGTILPHARYTTIGSKALRVWDSWADYVSDASTLTTCKAASGYDFGSHGGVKFFGVTTLSDALTLAHNGWSEPRQEIDALTDSISSSIAPTLKPAFVSYFDVSGGTVDIGRFLDGEPECMVETHLIETEHASRVVTILVNGCYSAGTESGQNDGTLGAIGKRGAAIVGLIDALERCQYSAEVWLEISHRKVSYLVKVKSASDALDVDVLMFAIGHKACFRHLNFAIQDCEKVTMGVGAGSSYGRVEPVSCTDMLNADIVLNQLRYGEPTQNPEVWIKEILSKYGLVTEEG